MSEGSQMGWGWRLFFGVMSGAAGYVILAALDLGLPPAVLYGASLVLAVAGAWAGPWVLELIGLVS